MLYKCNQWLIVIFVVLLSSCAWTGYTEMYHNQKEYFHVDMENKMAIASFIYEDNKAAKVCSEAFVDNIHPDIHSYLLKPSETDSILFSKQLYPLPVKRKLPISLLKSIEQELGVRYLLVGNIGELAKVTRTTNGQVWQAFEVYDLKTKEVIWAYEARVDVLKADPTYDIVLRDVSIEKAYDELVYKVLKEMGKQSNVRHREYVRKDN